MFYKVNTVNCAADWANTGFGDCPWHMLLEGVIQVPKDAVFTEAQLGALVAHVNTKVIENNRLLRFYPWPKFQKMEPSGGDPNKVENDDGSSTVTWENDYLFTGQFYAGGVPVNNALRTRNGQDIYYIGYGRGYAFGEQVNGQYKGFKGTNYWSNAQKPGAFKVKSEYVFTFNVAALSLNERVWYVKAPGIDELEGLKSLVLLPTTDPVMDGTGLVIADLKQKGYGDDYLEMYGAEIAGLTFTAKNAETGGAITVTGVSLVAGKLNFNLDDTDTDFPAVGEDLIIVGPSVSALIAAGVLQAEILPLTVTRTEA